MKFRNKIYPAFLFPFSIYGQAGYHENMPIWFWQPKTPLLKPHFYIVKLGVYRVYIIFLILPKNIDYGYSLEPPRWGSSNKYPRSMFRVEIWTLSEFFIWKFSFFGCKIFNIFEKACFCNGFKLAWFLDLQSQQSVVKVLNQSVHLPCYGQIKQKTNWYFSYFS